MLLEAAGWNFINTRRTAFAHNLHSEASFRFSRGVHPAVADPGLKRGLHYMAEWGEGEVAPGFVDEYPLPSKRPGCGGHAAGCDAPAGYRTQRAGDRRFTQPHRIRVQGRGREGHRPNPAHRMDIGEGAVGLADVLEEVARLYGYDNIPETRMSDELPPQVGNPVNEWEERLRDQLADLGLQEVVSYRMTYPEREARLYAASAGSQTLREQNYVCVANPIAPEKSVLRRSLLSSVLDALERNARLREGLALFEIGPIFEPSGSELPNEITKLAIVMTGQRDEISWDVQTSPIMDFYDLKGRIERLLAGFRLTNVAYAPTDSVPYLHPGKAAEVSVDGQVIGVFGELHPLVKDKYEFEDPPVLVAEFDLGTMRELESAYEVKPVPEVPPVLEDIALILDENIPAAKVEALIRQTGGKVLTDVRLFDVYRGEQIGAGKKSLAYSLTYQAEKTLTDKEAAAIRNRIVRRLEHELSAKLRS